MNSPTFLDRSEAAKYIQSLGLRITKGTLQKQASIGGGPIYRKFGQRVVYLKDDLDAWIDERLSPPKRHTSDSPTAQWLETPPRSYR